MILRRLSQNLREQNWTAITIEFVLLVAGVFLGIQVANWNEAQQGHAREAEFLARLERDFDKIDARLTGNISFWEETASASPRVLADLEAFQLQGSWPRSGDEILTDLGGSFDGRIPAPRAATYIELLSAGQLGLIRSAALRDALLDYDMQVGFSQTAFEVLMQRTAPYLSSVVSHLEFDAHANAADVPIGDRTVPIWAGVDLPGLAADVNAKTALNMFASASVNHLRVAKLQQEKARAVLVMLKSGVKLP